MTTRRIPEPPPGLVDHVSRREAARLLGYASEFPVRRLEQQGRLSAVRGAMGQAWYRRADVLRLMPSAPPEPIPPVSRPSLPPRARSRLSDAELVALLRQPVTDGTARPRTIVDLVADAGIGIARATRVYRFWLTHDVHPTAELARRRAAPAGQPPPVPVGGESRAPPPVAVGVGSAATASERRGDARRERDGLIRALRDPDPAVRARAFERLRARPPAP